MFWQKKKISFCPQCGCEWKDHQANVVHGGGCVLPTIYMISCNDKNHNHSEVSLEWLQKQGAFVSENFLRGEKNGR